MDSLDQWATVAGLVATATSLAALANVLAAAAATYLPLHGDALRLVVGLAVAAAWCALASWLNKRIRDDLGNLVDFGKLAIRRRRGADA